MASTIGHTIPLSAYMILFLGPAFFYLNSRKTFYRSWPLILISLTILLSFSRSSWISFLVVIILYFLSEHRSLFFRNWKMLAVLIVILILPFLLSNHLRQIFRVRTTAKVLKQEIVSSHRSASYKTVYNILQEYPILGVGLGNYPQVHDQYRSEGTSAAFKTPDNIYLRFLSETGIIGFVTIMAFFVYWLFRLIQNRKDPFIFAITASLIGFLVNQMAADLFYFAAPQTAFWLLFGIVVSNIDNY